MPEQENPQPENSSVDRISWSHLLNQLLAFFSLESGLLYTARELLFRPGRTMRAYLFSEERKKLSNPVGFTLITAAVTVFIMTQTGSLSRMMERGMETGATLEERLNSDREEGLEALSEEKLKQKAEIEARAESAKFMVEQIMTRYYNIMMLLSIPFLSLGSFLMFRRDKLLYTEHLVVNTYISGVHNMLFMPIGGLMGILPQVSLVYVLFSYVYQFWAYMDCFSGKRWNKAWRATIVIVLGVLLYGVVSGVSVAVFMYFYLKP